MMFTEERGRDPDISVTFSIHGGDFDPDDCSAKIGREPTEIWRQKRSDLAVRPDLAGLAWILATPWAPQDSVDEAVRALLDEIWGHRDEVLAYVQRHALSIVVECSVRIWSLDPLYNLTVETIQRLAHLGAEFALGLYDYREEDESDEPALE